MRTRSAHPRAIKSRLWRAKNIEKQRASQLRWYYKHTFGRTREQIVAMQTEQKVCACCGRVPERWHTDHDHTTGEFRGLLCDICNKAIGMLGDTLEGVNKAVKYLSATNKGQ